MEGRACAPGGPASSARAPLGGLSRTTQSCDPGIAAYAPLPCGPWSGGAEVACRTQASPRRRDAQLPVRHGARDGAQVRAACAIAACRESAPYRNVPRSAFKRRGQVRRLVRNDVKSSGAPIPWTPAHQLAEEQQSLKSSSPRFLLVSSTRPPRPPTPSERASSSRIARGRTIPLRCFDAAGALGTHTRRSSLVEGRGGPPERGGCGTTRGTRAARQW